MGCGDLISQFAVEKKTLATFDRMRSARFFIYGFIITVSLLILSASKNVWYELVFIYYI